MAWHGAWQSRLMPLSIILKIQDQILAQTKYFLILFVSNLNYYVCGEGPSKNVLLKYIDLTQVLNKDRRMTKTITLNKEES